jgi:predicted short-subunit dehydrogenase-like oxidoreductase (DUF2520 family)
MAETAGTPTALHIVVLGGGRLGATLARDLVQSGHAAQLVVRSAGRRDALAAHAMWRQVALHAHLDACEGPVDVLLVAVPDRALADIAPLLLAPPWQGAVALHLSGAASPQALSATPPRRGCGALHPLAAVVDPLSLPQGQPSPLCGALMAIGGDELAQAMAARLARDLGGLPIRVEAAQRPGYHAAAALIANDWVALADAAVQAAVAAGLEPAIARRGLLHLAHTAWTALDQLPEHAPLVRGLTGAVARGDAATLGAHMEALRRDPNALALHRTASLRLAAACETAGMLSATAAAVVREAVSEAQAPDTLEKLSE